MDTLTLANVGAYTAQVMLLVTLATALAWLLRIDAASVRYGYWRTIFALCLVLPLLQGRAALDVTAAGSGAVQTDVVLSDVPRSTTSALPSLEVTPYILPALAVGAGLRFLWLALSFARLRRLKRAGQPAPDSEIRSELREVIGTDCEIRYVPRLRQPVTFGWLRPVILLPTELAHQRDDIQRAVLSHELFHVKRRDWGWLLVEELTCALLWFNPAIWWLVSRVQLARELVVDELAVLATGRRRAYVEALMTFADETSPASVAAFGGRTQLFHRIVLLSKEAGMSSRRLVFTCAVVVAALGTGTWQVVGAFPLTAAQPQSIRQIAPGPLERQAKPITAENPIPRRTNYEGPVYPLEARAAGARGSVTLMITLDELGRVVEARRVDISVTSQNPKAGVRFAATNSEDERRFIINGSKDQSAALLAIVSAMDDAAVRAVSQWRYEPPHDGPISFPATLSFSDNQDAVSVERPIDVAPEGRVRTDGAIRVGGAIKTPIKLRDVRPVYPPVALEARASGMVILEIRVAADGSVEDAQVLRSIPLLDQAAIDAVMQWRFRPTLLNGQPVPVIMTVTVNFAVQGASVQRGRVPGGAAAGRRQMPEVVKEVKPSYTREALEAKVEGIVEMEATVGTDGSVTDARVIRSIPMLDEPALQAVRQWRFTPIPQPVAVNIEMTFTIPRRQ